MRTMKRRANRDGLTRRANADLPDGVGGTITGGPMAPIDIMEVLARGVTGAGAVSGAAQVVIGGRGPAPLKAHAVARGVELSDGSRISFASIADTLILDDGGAGDSGNRVPADGVGGNTGRTTARGTKGRVYGTVVEVEAGGVASA